MQIPSMLPLDKLLSNIDTSSSCGDVFYDLVNVGPEHYIAAVLVHQKVFVIDFSYRRIREESLFPLLVSFETKWKCKSIIETNWKEPFWAFCGPAGNLVIVTDSGKIYKGFGQSGRLECIYSDEADPIRVVLDQEGTTLFATERIVFDVSGKRKDLSDDNHILEYGSVREVSQLLRRIATATHSWSN